MARKVVAPRVNDTTGISFRAINKLPCTAATVKPSKAIEVHRVYWQLAIHVEKVRVPFGSLAATLECPGQSAIVKPCCGGAATVTRWL